MSIECIQCKKPNKPLVSGKCLDCYRLHAIDTAKKIRDSWSQKAKEVVYVPGDVRDPSPPLNVFFMKVKRFFYSSGEYILNKAIDKAIGKFSWIIAIILIAVVATALYRKLK